MITITRNKKALDSFDWKLEDHGLYVGQSKLSPIELTLGSPVHFRYLSQPAFIKRKDQFEPLEDHLSTPFQPLIDQIENSVCVIDVSTNAETGIHINLCSSRFSRSVLYYTITEDSLICSLDARDLLTYTDRRLNTDAAYAIIKYGSAPEYLTAFEGIYSIPVGTYYSLDEEAFQRMLDERQLRFTDAKHYYTLRFGTGQPNLAATEANLNGIFEFLSGKNPIVPVSGGVDSTLINHMLNQYTDEAYPAFYLQFGDGDGEARYAKEAITGTKAELDIINMLPQDYEEAFRYQATGLIQPVGESSNIGFANFYLKRNYNDRSILEGTLADGCYGSVNYFKTSILHPPKRPGIVQRLNEKLAYQSNLLGLGYHKNAHPRDALMDDNFVRLLAIYISYFANTAFIDARGKNERLLSYWQAYYNMLTPEAAQHDEWARYSIFKMFNYAIKTTTAKTHDFNLGVTPVYYLFAWRSVLEDQTNYSWADKTRDNIIKYPLKKILENYLPEKGFIYRKKVGLNSSFHDWLHLDHIKDFLVSVLESKDGYIAAEVKPATAKLLIKKLKANKVGYYEGNLINNICLMELWAKHNKLRF